MSKDDASDRMTESRGAILIVEDNPKNRKLIRRLLEIHQYDVAEAPDAETGIQMTFDLLPDLILMDIQLPGMDGLEATRRLKKTPETSGINIVALTSYAMQGDSEKARAAGCDGYVTKPINTRTFIDYISHYIRNEKPSEPGDGLNEAVDSQNSAKILIVDDEPKNLKLISSILKKEYPNIELASNGADALQIANNDIPDIVLLDIMMPEMDGFEVTRQLKANPSTRDIPIILITALDGNDYKVIGYEAGADEFLNKPIKSVELITRMKSLLDMKKCQDKILQGVNMKSDSGGSDQIDNFLSFQDHKILISISDSDHLKAVDLYLSKQIYDVTIANDLDSVSENFKHYPPDILIIDNKLHDEAYSELCKRIKKEQGTSNSQILYTVSDQELKGKFKQIEGIIDDFLTLPINVHELRARINVLIKKKAFLDRLYEGPSTNLQSLITDQLTGLYNFEYCKHVLKHELHRSGREHSTVSFVIMEVSHKLFSNGSIGHLAGDPLFKHLSELIKRSIRKLDIASRRSKSSYAFVLPEADDKKTQGFIHRMKNLFASQLDVVRSSEDDVDVLFSFGYAVCPDDSNHLDTLIEKAEVALSDNRISKQDESLKTDDLFEPANDTTDYR